ncbi:GNAT family N-acetyltransferase, partial [Pseudomonas aeruginosa]
GKGLAKQALESLERELKLRGFQQIKLRVAGDNERAKHVYEGSGFCVTGINMSKPLV